MNSIRILLIATLIPTFAAAQETWQQETSINRGTQSFFSQGNLGYSIRTSAGGGWAWEFVDGANTPFFHVEYNSGNVGVGTATPRGKFDVDGTGDIYLADDPDIGTGQSMYLPGHIFIAPYAGSNISYLQARRSNSTGTTSLRIRTYNAGVLTESMHIEGNGKVGIGTTSPDQLLTVNGTIHSKEVKVDLSVPAPDYVFEKDYNLPSLDSIKIYIDQHKHLPEVPSAKEMEANGVNLGEMNMLLLKKMEEMTLYMISQNEVIRNQTERIERLEREIKK